VNTQFQYLDVGVNIDVTPHVHANGEISLKISMDVSAVTGQSNIGGISQPIIGQRKIEHDIRLKDGEANLLGGIMEDQQTKQLSGIPGLAQIPILRYLFGQVNQDHSENEIVFAIVPHIIRGTDVNEINQRAIEIGTANAIELRHMKPAVVPAAAVTTGQNSTPAGATPASVTPASMNSVNPNSPNAAPASVPPGQPAIQLAPGAPAVRPAAPSNSPPGGSASFLFDPPTVQVTKGATFAVNLLISGAQNVYEVPVQLNYDPKMLQLVNVSNGGFLSQDGQLVTLVHREDESLGQSTITASRPSGAGGVSGQGSVITVTFGAKASGQTPLTVTRGGARDPGLQAITVNGAQASVTVE
jgi:general secretion pathway protein D